MYYKTLKTSATGKKFEIVSKKIIKCNDAALALAKELGSKEHRPGYWAVAGGISSLIFESKPESYIYKNSEVQGEYLPTMRTKKGKELNLRIDALPRVSIDELNMCIGFTGAPFKTIGFSHSKSLDYYGFTIGPEWGAKIPSDCEEITYTEYKKL